MPRRCVTNLPPDLTRPALFQGWLRTRYCRAVHWFVWDGQSLCRTWTREDTNGEHPTRKPESDMVCGTCRRKLAEIRSNGSSYRRPLEPGEQQIAQHAQEGQAHGN